MRIVKNALCNSIIHEGARYNRIKSSVFDIGTQVIASHSFAGKSESDITFNPSDIEEVEVPDSVVYLEGYAFEQCQDLKSIKLSQSIRVIPFYCFWRCLSLESIVIPKKVSIIEAGAFMWCKSLRTVYLPNSVCEIEEGAFTSCESLEAIYVPYGMKEKYSKMLDDGLEKYIVEQPIIN